jgi:hypothetical protein
MENEAIYAVENNLALGSSPEAGRALTVSRHLATFVNVTDVMLSVTPEDLI